MKRLTDPDRIHQAFLNSYKIIVKGMTVEDIIDEIEFDVVNLDILFAHDPESPNDKYVIEMMFDHFMDLEDYEKCSEIQKLL
jgi:hypothetical protein|tara:strand:+ start:694 stop:939 length:246 start_codon:yes stop_codon:yes gene_type:complete